MRASRAGSPNRRVDLARQPLRRQLGVRHDERGAGLLHPACVAGLVVAGGVRVRDEDRGLAGGGDLEDRPAGARDDEIGGGERVGELVDVAAQVVVRADRRGAQLVEVEVAPARGVQHAVPGIVLAERLDGGAVERARAVRAAEDDEHALRGRQAEARARRGAIAPPGGGTGRPVTR